MMPRACTQYWEGIDRPSSGRVVQAEFRWGPPYATDYDRACDVGNRVACIHVGRGSALVLGSGLRDQTCFVPLSVGGVFVHWGYGDSLESVEAWLQDLPSEGYEIACEPFSVQSSPSVLFDSAHRGDDVKELVELALPHRAYRVSSKTWRPDERTELLLVRLDGVQDAS